MGDVHPVRQPRTTGSTTENGRVIARSIRARLAKLDPGRLGRVRGEPRRLRDEADRGPEALGGGPRALDAGTEVVTYHNSWPNFLKRFKLVAAGYVEPKPGVPPSPAHTIELIDMMRAKKIR